VFTFYCETHRSEVRTGPSPSEVAEGRPLAPVCPQCFRTMFWVSNGGTVVPDPEASS
jgi:hypothetical protein